MTRDTLQEAIRKDNLIKGYSRKDNDKQKRKIDDFFNEAGFLSDEEATRVWTIYQKIRRGE